MRIIKTITAIMLLVVFVAADFLCRPVYSGGGFMPQQAVFFNFNRMPMDTTTKPYPELIDRILYTKWSNGFKRSVTNQNKYNRHIKAAIKRWSDIDPLILKSLLIQESDFHTGRINRHGYAGIAQLGKKEARHAGLTVKNKIDDRLEPEKAIQACVIIMRDKSRGLEAAFRRYGFPSGDEYWKFIAAAYNAGEGTVAKAIRIAYGTTKPKCVVFSDISGCPGINREKTPLYRALPRHWNKKRKFKEISEFASNVVNRARQ